MLREQGLEIRSGDVELLLPVGIGDELRRDSFSSGCHRDSVDGSSTIRLGGSYLGGCLGVVGGCLGGVSGCLGGVAACLGIVAGCLGIVAGCLGGVAGCLGGVVVALRAGNVGGRFFRASLCCVVGSFRGGGFEEFGGGGFWVLGFLVSHGSFTDPISRCLISPDPPARRGPG